jgi:dienelactone hydrolase
MLSIQGQAQNLKKNIDTSAFNKWGSVSGPAITNDGKYVGYYSKYGRIHDFNSEQTLTVKSTEGSWIKDFTPNIIKYAFTQNSKNVLILDHNNTLQVIQLGTGCVLHRYTANSFQLFEHGRTEWLLINSPDNQLTIVNTKINKENTYQNIKSYYQTASLNRLFLLRSNDALSFVDLTSMKETLIGQFKGITNLTLDGNGEMIAYSMDKVVWICNAGKGKPQLLADDKSLGIDTGLYISGINRFGSTNERLFITLTQKSVKLETNPRAVKVRVWNYKDSRLRTDPGEKGSAQSFLSFVELNDKKITQVQQEDENARFLNETNTDLISIDYVKGADYEKHWNRLAQSQHFIYDCKNKTRYEINLEPYFISPNGKYIIGTDSLGINYLVWSVDKHQHFDLTRHLAIIPDQDAALGDDKKYWKNAGWTDQHTLLLYDDNDIWKFDVSDPSKSTNLTRGIGKQENLFFTFLNMSYGRIYKKDELVFIRAFNKQNKQSGFYKLFPDGKKEPQKLTMNDAEFGYFYIKAKQADIWIVSKQRVDSSPNYFITKDFKSFKPLTNMYPEKEYKWVTSELVNFTTLDGKPSQAIMYKPNDFDPAKRYPVIIYYYQKFSDELHRYICPETAGGDLNVPWFVSKGYIIVKPDIQYTVMKPGESAVNSVEGVARHLAKEQFVDSVNIGLIGHSWGAFETNYIVSHSKFFKAAVSASGVSNLISATTSLTLGGANYKDLTTHTRYERFGKTMWQRPDLYIKNSPILDAASVETPILLMANEYDGIINVEQGVSFFWALRRLGKPAWLLQYEGEAHVLLKLENKLDYSEKVLEFFDHFLKYKPLPEWMNQKL